MHEGSFPEDVFGERARHGIAHSGVDGRYEMTGLGPYVHRLDLSGSETVNVEVPSFRDFDLVGRRP